MIKTIKEIGKGLEHEKTANRDSMNEDMSEYITMDPCDAAFNKKKIYELPETVWIVPLLIINSIR